MYFRVDDIFRIFGEWDCPNVDISGGDELDKEFVQTLPLTRATTVQPSSIIHPSYHHHHP